jgi:hypothetical protein
MRRVSQGLLLLMRLAVLENTNGSCSVGQQLEKEWGDACSQKFY